MTMICTDCHHEHTGRSHGFCECGCTYPEAIEATVIEITETSPMQREFNKGLAIAYINNHLLEDGVAHLDIRTSYFFYDEDKDFANFALGSKLNDEVLPTLYERTKIRYWSKGIV